MRKSATLLLLLLATACSRKSSDIWIGGDVHVGREPHAGLAPLETLFDGAPLVANLEGAVVATSGLLANAPAAVDLLAPPLVVATIENNHARDLGVDGQVRTAALLREIGVTPAGGPAGAAVLERNGVRWVVTAHDLPFGGPVPEGLAAEIREARTRGDVLVANFHVSGPEFYLPVQELRDAADIAIAAGADVVVSHGSHVIGPAERRGNAVIAWGLGNLLFSCDCTHAYEGMLLHVTKRGARLDAELVPVTAGLFGNPAHVADPPVHMLDLLDSISPAKLPRENGRALLPGS